MITPASERLYFDLLHVNLAAPHRELTAGGVALMLLDDLPEDERSALLRQRVVHREELIAVHEQAPKHAHDLGADLAIEQQLHLLRAEHRWLNTVFLIGSRGRFVTSRCEGLPATEVSARVTFTACC